MESKTGVKDRVHNGKIFCVCRGEGIPEYQSKYLLTLGDTGGEDFFLENKEYKNNNNNNNNLLYYIILYIKQKLKARVKNLRPELRPEFKLGPRDFVRGPQ